MTRWLIYTVLVGASPFLIRLLIYLLSTRVQADYIINEVDMVTFGLVLNVSNINELEDESSIASSSRSIYRGLSTLAIIFFGVILGVAYVSDLDTTRLFEKANIKLYSAVLNLPSLYFSYSIIRTKNAKKDG